MRNTGLLIVGGPAAALLIALAWNALAPHTAFAQWLGSGHFGLYTFICVVVFAVVDQILKRRAARLSERRAAHLDRKLDRNASTKAGRPGPGKAARSRAGPAPVPRAKGRPR